MRSFLARFLVVLLLGVCYGHNSYASVQVRSDKYLIVYYSWSGKTERIAHLLHARIGGTLVKVEPVAPYPEDYRGTVDRSQLEKVLIYDKNEYPAIKTRVENMEEYDVIFVCYPIWLGKMAMPMQSFLYLHSTGLKGKVIAPITSSGKTPGAKTQSDLDRLCPDAKKMVEILSITRDREGDTEQMLSEWITKL